MQAGQDYRGGLSAEELVGTLQELLAAEQRAMRLTCRYLADLADCMEGRRGVGGAGARGVTGAGGTWGGALAGYADVYHAARCLFGLGAHTTRERIRVGRALRGLPRIEEAFLSRELSYSRVREVTRVATANDESVWLLLGRELPIRTLERRVAEAAGKGPKARTADPAQVRRRSSETVEVTLRLPAATWALVQRAMEGARRASDTSLCDAEALEAIVRDALARQSTSGASVDRGLTPAAPHVSHSGTPAVSGASVDRGLAPAAPHVSHSGTPAVSGASVDRGLAPAASHRGGAAVAELGAGDSDEASTLLALFRRGGRWSVDALIDASGLPGNEVHAALVMLEIKGRIKGGWSGDSRAAASRAPFVGSGRRRGAMSVVG
ncbi:MAG: hypothetical protein R3F14_16970 [Polyangiaceae bacterium]